MNQTAEPCLTKTQEGRREGRRLRKGAEKYHLSITLYQTQSQGKMTIKEGDTET